MGLAPAAYAAFPQVSAEGSSQELTDETTSNCDVGSPSSGQYSLLLFGLDGIDDPTGIGESYTAIEAGITDNGNNFSVWGKIADGTEGATVDITHGANESQCHYYVLTGFDTGQAPEIACTAYTSVTTSQDPPNLTPTGGAKDYLWIVANEWDSGTSGGVTGGGFPTGFVSTGQDNTGSNGPGVAWGRLEENAASKNPDTFTQAVATLGVACTIAVHPSADSALQLIRRRRQ